RDPLVTGVQTCALPIYCFVSVIDCGSVVNPNTILAQLQNGVVFDLSTTLYDKINFENGRVKQRNFHDYQILRTHEMPEVEAHIRSEERRVGKECRTQRW